MNDQVADDGKRDPDQRARRPGLSTFSRFTASFVGFRARFGRRGDNAKTLSAPSMTDGDAGAVLSPDAGEHSPEAAGSEESGGFTAEQRAGGVYWDAVSGAAPVSPRTAWWNDPHTLRHINRIVCGEALEGIHAAFHRRLDACLRENGLTKPRALSVGSGNGGKEILLLTAGLIGSFDCFEVGAGAVEQGRRMAADLGLSERMHFHNVNAFTADFPGEFDLVYWNNALHHMPDTAMAVAWSRERLRPGGVFAMDDYVGASRFQHSPWLLAWTNRMLGVLPDRLLQDCQDGARLVPRVLGLINLEDLMRIDPTEAVDSAHILPAIRRVFPDATIIPTGGALYFIGLNNAFHNFTSEDDLRLLDALLLADEAVGQLEETQYAVALAVKR